MSATTATQPNGATGPKTEKKGKQSKNAFRRAKKKAGKTDGTDVRMGEDNEAQREALALSTNGESTDGAVSRAEQSEPADTQDADVEMDYEAMGAEVDDPLFAQFRNVISRFNERKEEGGDVKKDDFGKGKVFDEDENDNIFDEDEEEEQKQEAKLSKKKRKLLNQLSVAELKSIVRRPELVEWTDTSAHDPYLLISLKAARNAVPVPSHWSLKREYLSSKRGIEKPRFMLPKFIADTGISEMRDAALEKEADKSLKQRQRDRVAPKMGKLDIDYAKLYEAFFKHQTKPELTRFGEVYYEGKEWETNLKHLRPGQLSDGMHEALGIGLGHPPPWLIMMQRLGPPPGYPGLKVPGVNAPLPPGSRWGLNVGEWGRPATDDYGRPLWGGDVLGALNDEAAPPAEVVEVDKAIWGELQPREEEEEDEEEEEEDEEEDEDNADRNGPSRGGFQSTAPTQMGGVESIAGEFDLRKGNAAPSQPGRASVAVGGGRGYDTEEPPRQAYQILDERNIQNKGFFGGEKAYDMSQTRAPILGQEYNTGRKRKAGPGGDVEMAMDVDSLADGGSGGLSKEELRRRYDEGRREDGRWKGRVVDQDDLSQMIAEEGRKRVRKDAEDREKRRQGGGGGGGGRR